MKKYFSDRIKKIGKNILKYILELLVVTFGVFLGIYIGERNDQHKKNINIEKALTQIISELSSNSNRLEDAIEYHEQIGIEFDSLTNLLEQSDYSLTYYDNNKFKLNELPSWDGIRITELPKTIYESSKLGGVLQELNISTLKLISSIYEFQDFYSDYCKVTMNSFFEMNSETKIIDVISLMQRIVKGEIGRTEKELFEDMKEGMKELEKIVANKSYKK